MSRPIKTVSPRLALLTPCLCVCALGAEEFGWVGASRQLFDSPPGTYNYTPCAIEDGDAHHLWWCRNEVPFEVHDAIWYCQLRRGAAGAWESLPARVALGRTPGSWDGYHVCDPSVVRGSFAGADTVYRYALFYLGTDRSDCTNNRIGVAFASRLTGPWTKYEANPIVSGLADLWGVGQPSVMTIDCGGRLALFYTESARSGVRIVRTELDFSDVRRLVVGAPRVVTTSGLRGRNGEPAVFHNADFAHDVRRDEVVVVRPLHPFASEVPDFVSAELEVACIESRALSAGNGTWRVLGQFGAAESGCARNHNASIARDAFGRVPDPDLVRLNLSVGHTGADWLWSYRLHGAAGRRE